MRIMLCGDVHWCESSSIVRGYGNKYSKRLENLILSVNWVEDLAEDQGCESIIYMGDFFDKTELNAQEVTALSEVKWSNIPHTFLVGNHEVSRGDLLFSSTHLLGIYGHSEVVNEPKSILIGEDWDTAVELCYLPYITESTRKPIQEYFKKKYCKRVIVSHNDIKGFQMGAFLSREGFDIEDIEANCDLYINAHLHNGGRVSDKILNIGNLTGQNFSEDAFKYEHVVFILDTDTLSVTGWENPYALKFYKIDDYVNLSQVRSPAVCTVKCDIKDVEKAKELLTNNAIVDSRLIIIQTASNVEYSEEVKKELIDIDHLKQFSEYIIDTLGNTEIVNSELMEVIK